MRKKTKPAPAHFPFKHAVEHVIDLFQQARNSRNPALFLYRHDARTPLFMAESILRLLNGVDTRKKTAKGLKLVKKLEDSLGRIDYYDQLVKQFSKIKSVKDEQLDYFISHRDKALHQLNKKLTHKQFYIDTFQKLLIQFKINFNNTALIAALGKEMQEEIKICSDYYMTFPKAFTDLESQVHEIRRKLRWISIYAQSLQGVIALKPVSKHYKWESAFISKSSKDSPFNKWTTAEGLKAHVFLNQKAFYAMGSVIERLGEIKDRGLALEAFKKMLKKTKTKGPLSFEKTAMTQLKLPGNLKTIMAEAHHLLHQFFVKYSVQKELF